MSHNTNKKEVRTVKGLSKVNIPPRGTESVSEDNCDNHVKMIMNKIMELQEWNYSNIKGIFLEMIKVDPQFDYYKKEDKHHTKCMFVCKCYQIESIKCPVAFVFYYKNDNHHLPNEMIVFGGQHNHEDLLIGQQFRMDKREMRNSMEDKIKYTSSTAKENVEAMRRDYPFVTTKDIYTLFNKHKDISFIQFLEETKRQNQETMIVEYKEHIEQKEVKEEKPKMKRKKQVNEKQVTSIEEFNQLFSRQPELLMEIDNDQNVEETKQSDDQTNIVNTEGGEDGKTMLIESLCVDSFSLYFPIFFNLSHNIPLLFVDGCHHRKFNMTILVLATIDIMDKIQLVAIGGYRSESKESWKDFLKHLFERYSQHPFVIFSDRGTGFIAFMTEIENKCLWMQRFCIFHLFTNFVNDFFESKKIKFHGIRDECYKTFVAMSTSFDITKVEEFKFKLINKINSTYNLIIITIDQLNKWIDEHQPEKWLATKLPEGKKQRFEHCSTSIVESYNGFIIKERNMDVLDMIVSIMEKEQTKQLEAIQSMEIKKIVMKQSIYDELIEGLKPKWEVGIVNGMHCVKEINSKERFFCSLEPLYCSCGVPTDELRPCKNIARIGFGDKNASTYVPPYYHFASYLKLHQHPIVIPELSTIKCDPNEFLGYEKRKRQGERRKGSTFKDNKKPKKPSPPE